MFFKNMQVFRLDTRWKMAVAGLTDLLRPHIFTPCTGLQSESIGWTAPREGGDLVYGSNQQMLACLMIEKKSIPSSALKTKVKELAKELESQQGFVPGKKQLKELKERAFDALLPQVFPVRSSVNVWIDPVHGWIGVDSGTPSKADLVLKFLLKAIDSLPVSSLKTIQTPITCMTRWLAEDEAPYNFTVDNEAELQSTGESKATVKYTRHSLSEQDIRSHLESGKQCLKLAMTWNDRISFVLAGNAALKRIKPLDILKENEAYGADAEERYESDWLLMTGELCSLLNDLVSALGGEVKNDVAEAA